ncbi:MAG: hypothetical protein ACE5EI_00135 [Thermodesulfobacteriota bacterium]
MASFGRKYLYGLLACALALGLWAGLGGNALAKGGSAFKWKTTFQSEFLYDSNIYKLSDTQISRLDANKAADRTSGRFNDMKSADDFILTPRLKVTLSTPGLGGKELKISPNVLYNLYLQSQKKSHLVSGLDLRQTVGAHDTLGLDFKYAPNVFKKNYLTGTTNPSGPVLDSERIYGAATYDRIDVEASYRHRLWKKPGGKAGSTGIEKVYGTATVGLQSKEYDAPFRNRNEDSILGGAGLDLEFGKGAVLAFSYLFKSINTPTDPEILIRNETDFGVDLNADGDALDLDVATVQRVNRSRLEHKLGVKFKGDINDQWEGFFKYDIRLQDYQSTETFDVTRIDRQDFRHRFGLGFKGDYGSHWTLGFEGRYTIEDADRAGLATVNQAEQKSYNRYELGATLSYRL